MFKNKNLRRQMIFVGMSVFMVMVMGQIIARVTQLYSFEFTNEMPEFVSFAAEVLPFEVRATLTNTGDIAVPVSAEFIVVRQHGEGWWLVSVDRDSEFDDVETYLPPEHSIVFVLTDEMADLSADVMRIVTLVRKDGEFLQVWAEFTPQSPG